MSEQTPDEFDETESNAPEQVAIESQLPLTAIDIESQKDITPPRGHAIRGLDKWFAARPTPAARLAILASVYPGEIDSDQLLNLMQIGPKALDSNIREYVEGKFTESKGNGTLDDHYGYPNPNTQSPTETQIKDFHKTLADSWGDDGPTVLDPTAGRGIIPFETMRYGIDTKVNELNPIPALITKVGLEYAHEVGSLEPEITDWCKKIDEKARKNIEPYYPTKEDDRRILNSAFTYLIRCDSCGGEIPLVMKWWLHTTPEGGDAIRPIYENGEVEYEHVLVEETDDDYDPDEAPVTQGNAECPHCGVVTESDEVRERICSDEFEYSIYGVNYETSQGEWGFRAGDEIDQQGMQKAVERMGSDFALLDFLSEPIEVSSRLNDPTAYGMEEWRDIFTPRQLVVHYEYLRAYQHYAPEIQEEYSKQTAEAILTLLAFGASRSITRSSRLSSWRDRRGVGGYIFSENNYSFKKMAVDNNLSAPRKGYYTRCENVIEAYEKLVTYLPEGEPADIACQDAAALTETREPESVDVAVVDPPYYSSVQYAELSDLFYVLQKQYLEDVHPDLFNSKLTNKSDEAVANPARFEELVDEEQSKKELSDKYYEEKMSDIFSEIHDLLSEGGVITVMFTHREMEAWDTLTTAFINAGFTITATHPIKTEMADRVTLQKKASADSSILLVGRKTGEGGNEETTLWEDVESDIRTTAKQEAENALNSGYSISKIDTIISAYGPTLQKYTESYPVVNKKGDSIRPREALSTARNAVTGVLSERYLKTEGLDELDELTRWYVLCWLIYENDTLPYDEGRQLGVGVGIDIDKIKRSTKIWGKRSGEIQLKGHTDRVQDIVMLRNEGADNPSTRKYPVDPTDERFTYTIDTVHTALHVYDREGANAAWEWLTERGLKSDSAFEVTVTALLEVLPSDTEMYNTLVNLVSGETGDYLDINLDHIDMSRIDRQSELGDHTE